MICGWTRTRWWLRETERDGQNKIKSLPVTLLRALEQRATVCQPSLSGVTEALSCLSRYVSLEQSLSPDLVELLLRFLRDSRRTTLAESALARSMKFERAKGAVKKVYELSNRQYRSVSEKRRRQGEGELCVRVVASQDSESGGEEEEVGSMSCQEPVKRSTRRGDRKARAVPDGRLSAANRRGNQVNMRLCIGMRRKRTSNSSANSPQIGLSSQTPVLMELMGCNAAFE
jgi:hypothetical protein